jgi:hypothetical protein
LGPGPNVKKNYERNCEPARVEHNSAHFLPTNISLGWKNLSGTNAQAYFVLLSAMKKKSFTTLPQIKVLSKKLSLLASVEKQL